MASVFTKDFRKADDDLKVHGYFDGETPLEEALHLFDWRLLEIYKYRRRIEEAEEASQKRGIEKIRSLLKEANVYEYEVASTIFLQSVGAKPALILKVLDIPKSHYDNAIKPNLPTKRYYFNKLDGGNAKMVAELLHDYLKETGRIK